MSCIESTMVPVAVYRGTPVRRYLWSGGNVGTINSAVQVGKLETGKKKQTWRESWNKQSFVSEILISLLTSGYGQNLCFVLPIDYID